MEESVDEGSIDLTGQYYQLTDDYMVPSLRDWLTRKQRETRRGRAEMRLAELSDVWNRKQENRNLPSSWELWNIRLLTNKRDWTEAQRRLIKRASRVSRIRWGAGVALVILVACAVVGVRLTSLSEQAKTIVEVMRNTRGTSVPRVIADLDELPRVLVRRELSVLLSEAEGQEKLALVYAQAHFGSVDVEYLISSVQNASPDEAANLVNAFGKSEESLEAIRSKVAGVDFRFGARLGIVALHLGDPSIAKSLCELRNNREQRTYFIDEMESWHGELTRLAESAATLEDPALRSALCLAVGGVSRANLSDEAKQAWRPLFFDWYRQATDKGVHIAADWVLREWQETLPVIPATPELANGFSWHVNSVNMTFLEIPAGSFQRIRRNQQLEETPQGTVSVARGEQVRQQVTLTRSFLLSAREVTSAVFAQFVQETDLNSPLQSMPVTMEVNGVRTVSYLSNGRRYSTDTAQRGKARTSWEDAVQFCNWLSRREGLASCYQKQWGSGWQLLPGANGYRLPTEAEWEHACRAGTNTNWSFGNVDVFLPKYGEPTASRSSGDLRPPEESHQPLPNAWGVVEAYGSEEWCHDWFAPTEQHPTEAQDPMGPSDGMQHVSRGRTDAFMAGTVYYGQFGYTSNGNFRVARTKP